jgi:hypothetical protein
METALRQYGNSSPRAQLIAQFLAITTSLPATALKENPILAFHQRIALDSLSPPARTGESQPSGFFTYFWMSVWILTLHQLGVSAVMEEVRSRSFQFDWQTYRRARETDVSKAWLWHDGNRISPHRNGLKRGGTLARLLHRDDGQAEVELWRITSVDTQSIKVSYLDGWTLQDEEMQQPVDVMSLAARLRPLHLPETNSDLST